jgi:hypothetical protein
LHLWVFRVFLHQTSRDHLRPLLQHPLISDKAEIICDVLVQVGLRNVQLGKL